MSQIATKYYNGRGVKEEKIFYKSPNLDFGALYEATAWLNSKGYNEGSLCMDEPIGFVQGGYRSYGLPEKWKNMTKTDKKKLSGMMLSDNFRNGNVKVVLLED